MGVIETTVSETDWHVWRLVEGIENDSMLPKSWYDWLSDWWLHLLN